MNIVNCTPHAIVIVEGSEYVAEIRKHIATDETKKLVSIAPSGTLLNAKMKDTSAQPLDFYSFGGDDYVALPTIKTEYESVDELPEDADFVIVSALYVAARRELGLDCSKCLTVGTPVYESKEKPFPMGVMSLRRN